MAKKCKPCSRGLGGTPGATRGNYAYAGITRGGGSAIAYCARSKDEALAQARRGLISYTSACVAIAKGETCNDAKKAAKRTANAKCKPCRFFKTDYNTGNPDLWNVVEVQRGGVQRFVSQHPKGKPTMDEIDRLSKQHCPRGTDLTPEEAALSGLRKRR